VSIESIRPHELFLEDHVREVMEDIRKSGVVRRPLIVDASTLTLLDGAHRLEALRRLGASLAPVIAVDYSQVEVEGWAREYELSLDALSAIKRLAPVSFSRFDEGSLEKWAREVAEAQAFTVDEAKLFYRKYVWNRGLYRGRKFSIHPVKLEDEVHEEWEQTIHKPLCIGTIRARVVDSRDSLFMPAVYVVNNVEIIDGCRVDSEVRQVVSYESLYIDVAQPGDEIIARGKFEHVTDTKTGDEYAQVVVGSYEAQGKDFIRPVSLS